jgi:hypothetical protein
VDLTTVGLQKVKGFWIHEASLRFPDKLVCTFNIHTQCTHTHTLSSYMTNWGAQTHGRVYTAM